MRAQNLGTVHIQGDSKLRGNISRDESRAKNKKKTSL